MLPSLTLDDMSRSSSSANCRETRHEIVKVPQQAQSESRVSTDSDLDLESEENYDSRVDGDDYYPDTFPAELLMHRLKQVQEQSENPAVGDAKDTLTIPFQQFELVEESYWEKMRRISRWRESTHQSETSSDYSPPEPESQPTSPPTSRKRRLSDASLLSSAKRARFAAPSPATPSSPFLPFARAYSLGLPSESSSERGGYPRAYPRSEPLHETLHVCTACDAAFASRQRLRRHGHVAPDACRAAVTYVLE